MGGDSTAGLRAAARLGYTDRVQAPNQHRYWNRLAWLVVMLACGRGQARDQADFWQEALPDPIAVLDPWISVPTSTRVTEDDWQGHVVEITRFVEGPADATGADHTVHLRDPSSAERRLHLRLAPGTALPLFRNETLRVRTFARQTETGAIQRSVIVLARRPLGKGADFKPVLILSLHDDLLPVDALPTLLASMARTEQIAYREARIGDGECTVSTTHYLTNAGIDARATVTAVRRRPLYPPGAHLRRQDREAAYDVTIHDARRTSVAPCPFPDESALVWSAVWVEEEAAKATQKPATALMETVLPPAPVTPTAAPPTRTAPRKPRKTQPHEATPHEHQAPKQ
jgi:hypothetical protein